MFQHQHSHKHSDGLERSMGYSIILRHTILQILNGMFMIKTKMSGKMILLKIPTKKQNLRVLSN